MISSLIYHISNILCGFWFLLAHVCGVCRGQYWVSASVAVHVIFWDSVSDWTCLTGQAGYRVSSALGFQVLLCLLFPWLLGDKTQALMCVQQTSHRLSCLLESSFQLFCDVLYGQEHGLSCRVFHMSLGCVLWLPLPSLLPVMKMMNSANVCWRPHCPSQPHPIDFLSVWFIS